MRFLIRKFISIILTLFLVSIMIFLIFQVLPGNPAEIMLGTEADKYQIQLLEKELGVDKPMIERYGSWLVNLLHGDMGKSIKYQVPVADLFASRFPVTLFLTLYSLAITLILGIPLGIWVASRDSKWYGRVVGTITQLGISIPSFWISFLLMLVFSLKLKWFPTFGYNVMDGNFFSRLYSFFLPAFSISISNIAVVVRYLRTSILEQMRMDYVRTALVKGQKQSTILYRHVLRNALIPVLTILGIIFTSSIGGSIIIENVFALPGLGSLIVQSVSSRDFVLIQSVVLIIATMVIFINFAIDILYQVIDPRIRSGD
ncbi:ABC transporter permease [Anaerosphaera multitolerans]|uniref:ABC transporter permease n=1 Tax=Anaerosphaera multitolerans TaxID=2487351 RepID=A0A437S947_9FIRM|nr:ABC transporter permease [Anaerosphaera multitolerans]RVU55532.1 ABC transporter permease [Anaerosphaera multitolerans]